MAATKDRQLYVRLKQITSDTVVSSTDAPQRTVPVPLVLTLYTSNFCYNLELCHVQRYANNTVIMGCIRNSRDEEYRNSVRDFVAWWQRNHLELSTSKTKELVIDFGKSRPSHRLVLIKRSEVEVVVNYKYLGQWLDWYCNTDHLYKMGRSSLYFLRMLRSSKICR